MKRTQIGLGVLAVTLIAGALTAYAANGGLRGGAGPRGPAFDTLDLNGDGSVTQDELAQIGANRFAASDTDGSGTLSADELMAARDAALEARANRRLTQMMAQRDANNDGVLSLDEMQDDRRANRFLDRMDANNDGAVTAAEFEAAQAKMGARRGSHQGARGDKEGAIGVFE